MDLAKKLYFFGDIIALQASGAYFEGNGSSAKFSFYLDQVGFPGSASTIFGMANLIASDGMFSANCTSP